MRPWLLNLGPMLISCDAREELQAIGYGLTPEEFADKIWDRRIEAAPTVRKSHRKKWPMRKPESNVTQLPVKKRGRS